MSKVLTYLSTDFSNYSMMCYATGCGLQILLHHYQAGAEHGYFNLIVILKLEKRLPVLSRNLKEVIVTQQ